MTGSNKTNAISLTITQFPQNLLIPNIDNAVSLEVINNLDKQADFKFEFKGENIDIEVIPQEFNDNIKLNAKETRKIELKLTPKVDGYGKLIINVYWLKIIEYTEKVQKIRTTISHSVIKKILAKIEILDSKTIVSFNHNEFMVESSKNGIKKTEKELELLQERYTQQLNANQKNGSVTINQIDALYKDLAKSYLTIGDIYKALENALKLSNQEAQTQFYYDLIRVFAFKNLEQSLQIIKNLNDEKTI